MRMLARSRRCRRSAPIQGVQERYRVLEGYRESARTVGSTFEFMLRTRTASGNQEKVVRARPWLQYRRESDACPFGQRWKSVGNQDGDCRACNSERVRQVSIRPPLCATRSSSVTL